MQAQFEIGIENLSHGTEQILFCDKNACISCLTLTTRNLQRSSEARATRNFIVYETPLELIQFILSQV